MQQVAVYAEPESLTPRGDADSDFSQRPPVGRRWVTDPPRWRDWERFLLNKENEPLFSTIKLVRDLECMREQSEFSTAPFQTYYSRPVVRAIAKIYLRLELHHRDYQNFTIGESNLIASRLLRLLWSFGSNVVLALRGPPALLDRANFRERYSEVVFATNHLPATTIKEVAELIKMHDDSKFDSMLNDLFYIKSYKKQEEDDLSI